MEYTPSQVPVENLEAQNQPQSAPSLKSRLWPACKWAGVVFVFTASVPLAAIFGVIGWIAGLKIGRAQAWRPAADSIGAILPAPSWATRLRGVWTRGRGLLALGLGVVWMLIFVCYRSPYVWIGGAAFGAGLGALCGAWKNFGSAIAIPSSLPYANAVTFVRRWRALVIVAAAAIAALQFSNAFYPYSFTGYTKSYSTVGGPTLSVDRNGHWVHGYQSTTTTYNNPYTISGTDMNAGVFLLGLLGLAITFHVRRTPPGLEPVSR